MKIERPAYGEPCNGCGVCCQQEQCPLSLFTFGRVPGPCPALEPEGDRFVCGLVTNPQRYNPIRTFAMGIEKMRAAALILIGADAKVGCDCALAGDLINDAYRRSHEQRTRYVSTSRYRKARATWGAL